MSPGVKKFLQSWLINTVAVLVVAQIVRGIHYDTNAGLIVATLVLGIFNTFLRPLLLFLSLPLLLFTLGLFTLVINAVLLYWVGSLVRDFHVDTFGAAFWGALGIGIISLVLHAVTGTGNTRIVIHRRKSSRRHDDDGGGPIIDV
jgi:putative membrane protein